MAAIHFTLSGELYTEFQAAMIRRKARETPDKAQQLERGDKRRYTSEAIRLWVEEEKVVERQMAEEKCNEEMDRHTGS